MAIESQRSVLTAAGLETLARGRVVEQVNERLAEALAHCVEFPNLEKPRTLTLTLTLKPVSAQDAGGEIATNIASKVDVKLPGLKGPVDRAVLLDGEFQVLNVPTSAENQTDIADFAAVKQQRSES